MSSLIPPWLSFRTASPNQDGGQEGTPRDQFDLLPEPEQPCTQNAAPHHDSKSLQKKHRDVPSNTADITDREHALYEEQARFIAQISGHDHEINSLQNDNLRYRDTINTKDQKIHELQQEIFEYKKSISGRTRIDGQLSDMTIKQGMDSLFYAIRDWALVIARQEKSILDLVDQNTARWLRGQLPGLRDGSSAHTVHALIALVSDALCLSRMGGWLFGMESAGAEIRKSPIAAANYLWESIRNINGVTSEKHKQWALLTNELLSKDEDASQQSLKDYSVNIARYVQNKLGDSPNASVVAQKLQLAIRPQMHLIQALYHQEAEYDLQLFPAKDGRIGYLLTPALMEDVNGEEEGLLQASFFPALYKLDRRENDGKVESIVISKAKVMVES